MRRVSLISNDQMKELSAQIGEAALITSESQREIYGADELMSPVLPALVVEPDSTQAISALMKWASKHQIPVTPRGAGTGLSGGAIPLAGGVVLSMAKLNQILSIDPVNRFAVVQPGVINLDFQRAVEELGLFYPPDPASWDSSTLGGNVAEDAGGPRCVKYGVTRNYVMQLKAVLPGGEEIVCGTHTRKSVVGYSLRDLLVGSEGTLAVITEITLRLLTKPKALQTLLLLLSDFQAAADLIPTLTKAGLTPAVLEFMDDQALDLVRDRLPFALPDTCRALLLIEFDGHEAELEEAASHLMDLMSTRGIVDILVADSEAKRQKLWDVRRKLSPTTRELFAQKLSEDVALPLDRLGEYLNRVRKIGEDMNLKVLGYGHLGDGNVHTNILSAVKGEDERRRMWACVDQIFDLALELGGTLSAEHGIGCWKQPWIDRELSPDSLFIQKGIKEIFDPDHLLNPGKIFNWEPRRSGPRRPQIDCEMIESSSEENKAC
jgi:glycolate oxidase